MFIVFIVGFYIAIYILSPGKRILLQNPDRMQLYYTDGVNIYENGPTQREAESRTITVRDEETAATISTITSFN